MKMDDNKTRDVKRNGFDRKSMAWLMMRVCGSLYFRERERGSIILSVEVAGRKRRVEIGHKVLRSSYLISKLT